MVSMSQLVFSQLRKGNFFMTFGGEGLTKTQELFDTYQQKVF